MDFVGNRKIWFSISALIIIAGMAMIAITGLNLSIDYTGGNLLELQFSEEISSGQIRNVLKDFNLEKTPVQSSGDRQFIIRTHILTEKESENIVQGMEKEFGEIEVLRNENVGAVIGRELTRNAFLALIVAFILMIAYITYRFELNFALASIAALTHDVLFILAFMAFFQLEIDSSFVAVILTIVGYSINNTIVIFDRVRENLRSPEKRKDLHLLVNESIMQTMTRSLNTSGTTSLTLLALIFLGGATTKVFATALLVGVIVGTYSSIFIASPLWLTIRSMRSGGKELRPRKA